MNPTFRYIFMFAKIFLVILLIIQPYNFYCNLTSKCRPFYFSYLIPKREGKVEFKITPETINYIEDLIIAPEQESLTTVVNRKNIVTYTVKNDSEHFIRFRPSFYVLPEEMDQYITRFECDCSKTFKLKKGQSTTMKVEFELKREFEEEYRDGAQFKIGFKTLAY